MEIVYVENCESTNSTLREFSKKNAKSWTVVWTKNQTKGKGYSGNAWHSEPNQNIACSLLIKTELDHQELIYFNMWVCNCISAFLSNLSSDVYVKWPNDIILKNKKIGGILLETFKHQKSLNIIVGFGLNVNQENFEHLPHAGSLKTLIGKSFQLDEILSGILTELKNCYPLVEEKRWVEIINSYNENLYRRNKVSNFVYNQIPCIGLILGVEKDGSLLLKLENGEIKSFIHKEIEFVYES